MIIFAHYMGESGETGGQGKKLEENRGGEDFGKGKGKEGDRRY